MNAAAMLTLLNIYLEDSDDGGFSSTEKYNLLSRGQERLIRMLPTEALHEIERLATSQSLSNQAGVFDNALLLSGLSDKPAGINWGNLRVRDSGGTNKWARRISWEEFQRNDQRTYTYSREAPRFVVYGDYLHVEPDTISAVDLYLIETPLDISSSQDSELNDFYHEWVVELGAYYGWRASSKAERAKGHLAEVADGIEELNNKLSATGMVDPMDQDFDEDDHSLESFRIKLST